MISCLAPVKESCDGTGVLISLTCLDAVQKGSDLVKVITKATATVERPFAITDGGPAGQSLICPQYIVMKRWKAEGANDRVLSLWVDDVQWNIHSDVAVSLTMIHQRMISVKASL